MTTESGLARNLKTGASRCGRALLVAAGLLAAGAAHANLTDTFTRADNAAIGNGWIEKNASAFSLQGGTAAKLPNSAGYRDNLVYRPAAEDVADVEASVEFRLTAADPGYPQIHVRVQSSTVGFANWLDSYVLYVAGSNSQAVLGRQESSSFVTTLANITLSPALNTTDNFRLRLRATGASPVLLNAVVEREVAGSWQVIGQANASDSSGARIGTAGSVGFSGFVEGAYRYDNFVRVNLDGTPPNPSPTLATMSPTSATEGESGLILTVVGTGFLPTSQVRWNGAPRTTAFISDTVLEATIPASDLATAASSTVTVYNPAPGGGVSGGLIFTVLPSQYSNPVPVLTAIAPNQATAGGPAFTLVVTGSGFATDAVVRWNGASRPTTFVSPTELRAQIASADIATAGTYQVSVFNPAPGGGLSGSLGFVVQAPANPVPVLTALNPVSRTAGAGAFTLTVTGGNFLAGSVVRWNGNNRTTTFVSATTLTAAITAADVQSAGTAAVTVFNPAPGGGTSGSLSFTITASGGGGGGGLAITSLAPISATIGVPSVLVTVNGGGFTTGSVVRWNGANRPTTYVSASQLRVTLPGSDLSADSIGAITVANGTTVSQPLSFFVLPASDTVFFDGFNRGPSASIGGNWVEKTPGLYEIRANGTLWAGNTYPLEFHDAIVYRPFAESQLNSESGVEFVREANGRFPQVHSRVQAGSIAAPMTLESYILYVEDGFWPNGLAIGVQAPVQWIGECIIGYFPFTTLPEVGQRYRLRFRVEGTYPVRLTGIMERYNGSFWEVFASGSMNHDANTVHAGYYCPYATVPGPISTAGSFGLAKWYDPLDGYDNFYWRSLSAGAPPSNIPGVTALSPSTVVAGSGSVTLTVDGANFVSGSVVRWNGSNRATTFVSATRLQAAIPASDLAAAGTANITVFNPGTGGGTSPTSLQFFVTAPPSGQPGLQFFDEFARPNSSVLGNAWSAKSATAFSLENGQARKQAVNSGYRDNIVYRPASEALLNAEVSTEFRLLNFNVGYPQILTRVQSATVGVTNVLDGYILYFNGSGSQAILGRQNGSAFVTTLATLNLSSALNTTDTYRLRLRATGTSPVELQSSVERLVNGSWVMIGQATASDSSGARITAAGVAGFGGFTENSYAFDNFAVFNLTQ